MRMRAPNVAGPSPASKSSPGVGQELERLKTANPPLCRKTDPIGFMTQARHPPKGKKVKNMTIRILEINELIARAGTPKVNRSEPWHELFKPQEVSRLEYPEGQDYE